MSNCLHKQHAVLRRVFSHLNERHAFPLERIRTRRAAMNGNEQKKGACFFASFSLFLNLMSYQ